MTVNEDSLLTVLEKLNPSRLGEVNLLLGALSDNARELEFLPRVVSQMAGKCDRIPQPRLYLALAQRLGIIQVAGEVVELTYLGRLLLSATKWPPYDRLSQEQVHIVAPEILCHPEVSEAVVAVIRMMASRPDQSKMYKIGYASLTSGEIIALQLLQVLGVATVEADEIVISKEGLTELRRVLGVSLAVTEKELLDSLMQNNIRARTAEEYVVEFERRRLAETQRPDLSQLVERISAHDVGAGYDIRSFNSDGSVRYIEVKSSTKLSVTFYWTLNERRMAEERANQYWIYFVPRAQDLPERVHGLVLVNDPVAWCGILLHEDATEFKVSMSRNNDVISKSEIGGVEVRSLVQNAHSTGVN